MIGSSDSNLKELFSDNNYLFEVPNYQRYYVWEKKNVICFLEDCFYCLNSNRGGKEYQHFFGQIILRKINEDRSNRLHMEIIDGQQRLTTFTMLISVIFRKLVALKQGADDELIVNINSYLKELKDAFFVSEPQYGTTARKLKLSNKDNGLFINIVDVNYDESSSVEKPSDELLSLKNIFDAFSCITKYLNDKFSILPAATQYEQLKEFVDIISNKIRIVLLKTTVTGYNYALYQIVNDRGVCLTTAELLKARTMELLYNNDAYASSSENIWNDILSDSGTDTQQYLIWHYTANLFTVPSAKTLQELYEKNIFNCKGKHSLTPGEQTTLHNKLKELQESIIACRKLSKGIFPQNGCNQQVLNVFKVLIERLKNISSIPIYLNILKGANNNVRIKQFENITHLLSKFFYVAKSICNTHATSISNCYNEIAKSLTDGTYTKDNCKSTLETLIQNKGCIPTFYSHLSTDVYLKSSITKSLYLLFMIELYYNTDDYSLASLKRIGDNAMIIDFANISNEHVLAQSLATTEEENKICNKLGNLTIMGTTPNGILDDKPYNEKKVTYSQSPFAMTRAVSENDIWDLNAYSNRQQIMVDKAKQLFVL